MWIKPVVVILVVSALIASAQFPANPLPLSLHMIDINLGSNAVNVSCRLYKQKPTGNHKFQFITSNVTNINGRIDDFLPVAGFSAGTYRIWCNSTAYFEAQGRTTLFPAIQTTFYLLDQHKDHHVVFLINAFGFTTYRGVKIA